MENKIATTIEQSKKLIEFGLSVKNADMHYKETQLFGSDWILSPYGISYYYENEIPQPAMYIPAWSLAALIDVLPASINVGNDLCTLKINKYYNNKDLKENYSVCYLDKNNNGVGYFKEKLLDAILEMIIYLKENKLI